MNNIIKQLKRGAKYTHLSSAEKAEMKSVLLRHVKSNPVSNEVLARHHNTKGQAILSPLQVNNLRNKKTMPILVILGLLMSGSVSFAAEATVPGDILYPVKVHVNESVRGVVTVSPSAKAEWELHLVERRLEEVEKLATRPNAAPQAQEQAQENLVKYTKHVEDRIAKFEEDEDGEHALKTASDLSGVFATYEALLAALASTQPVATATTSTSAATVVASSTATTTPTVASSTPATTLTPANIAALREILSKLNEVQDDAEEKHKELKKKYHKEENDDEEGSNEDEDEHDRVLLTPALVLPPLATTTPEITSTSTATTTSGTIATSTQRIRIEKHDDDNQQEEIHTTTAASSTAISTPRESRERTESRDSHDDND